MYDPLGFGVSGLGCNCAVALLLRLADMVEIVVIVELGFVLEDLTSIRQDLV